MFSNVSESVTYFDIYVECIYFVYMAYLTMLSWQCQVPKFVQVL